MFHIYWYGTLVRCGCWWHVLLKLRVLACSNFSSAIAILQVLRFLIQFYYFISFLFTDSLSLITLFPLYLPIYFIDYSQISILIHSLCMATCSMIVEDHRQYLHFVCLTWFWLMTENAAAKETR